MLEGIDSKWDDLLSSDSISYQGDGVLHQSRLVTIQGYESELEAGLWDYDVVFSSEQNEMINIPLAPR